MSLKGFRGTNDPVNIMGISALVTDFEDIKSNVDLAEIEKEIVDRVKKSKHAKSAPEIFKQELDAVLKGSGGIKLYDDKEIDNMSVSFHKKQSTPYGQYGQQTRKQKPQNDMYPKSSYMKPSAPPKSESDDDDTLGIKSDNEDDNNSNAGDDMDFAPPSAMRSMINRPNRTSFDINGGREGGNGNGGGNGEFTRSTWFDRKTREEKAQDIISSVLGQRNQYKSISQEDKELENLIAIEQEKDMKAMLVAQYDLLKTTLLEEKVDLTRVPVIDENSSLAVINAALKMLRYKNDLRRYVSIGEDLILFMGYGLEAAFDGKTSYFSWCPDLTGWTASIKPRIKRMRADTSQVVSGVMNNFNFGSFTRMLLELVPSAFLYSKVRRDQKKGSVTNDQWTDSIHKMDLMDPK